MKVTLLTSISKHSANTGDGRYSTEIINNLNKLKIKDIEINIIQPAKEAKFLRAVFFDIFILPFKILKSKSDFYHALTPGEVIAPVLLRRKTVVTLHDVIYVTYPRGTKFLKRLYFHFATYFIKRADLIITSSDFSKKEIIRSLHIDASKIRTVYLGIDGKFKPLNTKRDNVIGYLGGSGGRKNIDSLLRAFSIFERKNKNYKLVMALKPNSSILEKIDELGIKNIIFKDKISEEKIVEFYNSLKIFIFPSVYEGFGFPPLEAMACGCPVICSDKTSVGEVVGKAAYIVNTKNPKEIAMGIKEVLNPKKYEILQSKGLKQSSLYTWDNTAIETINCYKYF